MFGLRLLLNIGNLGVILKLFCSNDVFELGKLNGLVFFMIGVLVFNVIRLLYFWLFIILYLGCFIFGFIKDVFVFDNFWLCFFFGFVFVFFFYFM